MRVIDTVEAMRRARSALPGPVGLVATMGALHDGHLAHVEALRPDVASVVVSIFVNPTQFGPHEDYSRYPRPIEDDLARCEAAGVDAVFKPPADEVYPPGGVDAAVDVPRLTRDLEATQRPGHFQGVCRVVMKLLQMIRPDVATFGRKDYQQLRVVQAMVADLAVPVRVLEVPTVREPDGLAMSSRNRYLDPAERQRALGLYRALCRARDLASGGETDPAAVEAAMRGVLDDAGLRTDYAAVRHPFTLEPVATVGQAGQASAALIAARLGAVRLLDNMRVGGVG